MRRTLANLCAIVIGSLGLAVAGCSSSEKIRLTESGAPDFQSLEIVYDVDSAGGLAGPSEPNAVRPAGLSDSGHADQGAPTRLRLEIQYPYPGIHPEFVHATLRVVAAGANGSDLGLRSGGPTGLQGFSNANSHGGGLMSLTVGPLPATPAPNSGQECLVLDMPKSELTALFLDLANDGFFQRPAVKEGQSHLEVMYNKGQVDKVWTREPRLEDLVALLKRHGTPSVEGPQQAGPRPGFYTGRYGKS